MTLESDLRTILDRGIGDRKFPKLRSRIIEEIVGAEGTDVFRERLEIVTTRLERACRQRSDHDVVAANILEALTIAALDGDRFDACLGVYTHTRGMSTSTEGLPPDAELRIAGLRAFLRSWFRVIGSTVERSAGFALDLLESIGETGQQFLDATEASQLSTSTLMTFQVGFFLVSEAAAEPAFSDRPLKGWIERLISSAHDNPAVEEILNDILRVLTMGRPHDDHFLLMVVDDAVAALQIALELGWGRWVPSLEQPLLVLTRDHAARYHDLRRDELVVYERRRAQGEATLAWFRDHRGALEARAERQWSEMSARPRRALLPGGDHIEITVPPLHNAGIRGIILHPDGRVFPHCGVELLIRKETPHLLRCRTDTGAMDAIPVEALHNTDHQDLDVLRALLRVVVIDVLHRIVVADRPLRERPRRADAGTCDGKQRRPHLRRLPEGRRASAAAIGRAETRGWTLPLGVTFVRANYEDGRIVHALPTEPNVVYGDEDLRDLGAEVISCAAS